MVRTAFIMGLVLVAACGKDVEDPGFTASGTATMSTTATSSGSGDTSSGPGMTSAGSVSDSADSSTSDPTNPPTTGPTEETGASGCGDGAISPGEQCDGADLQDFTCMSLGLNGGTLACDPVVCTFDTSMCMSTSGGTSG